MVEEDPPGAVRLASAVNMLQCLTMLAQEAERLGMPRTALALSKAVRACHAEPARPVVLALRPPRRHVMLH